MHGARRHNLKPPQGNPSSMFGAPATAELIPMPSVAELMEDTSPERRAARRSPGITEKPGSDRTVFRGHYAAEEARQLRFEFEAELARLEAA